MKRDTNRLFKKQQAKKPKLYQLLGHLPTKQAHGLIAQKLGSMVTDDRASSFLDIINILHEHEEGDLVLKSIQEMQDFIKNKPLVEAVGFCKGRYMGMCNRKDCLQVPATWYNVGTSAYYCQPCAFSINYRPPFLCYRGHKSERPDDFVDPWRVENAPN